MPYTVEANAVAVPVRTYLNECVVAGRFLHYCRECGNCNTGKAGTFSFSSNKAWERYPCRSMRKGWNSAACSAIVRCICWAERAEMLHHLENGVKDCSKCLIPHQRDNYGYLAGRFQEIAGEIARHEQEPRAE